MMNRLLTGTLVAFAIASGPAFACAEPPAAHVAQAAEAKPKVVAVEAMLKTADPAVEARFKTADKNSSGTLEGAEVEAYKATLAKIDANKDGKVSREEFAVATRAGLIK
jgi:hypothetical protein